MVVIKGKKGEWNLAGREMETVIMDKHVRDEFRKFCKEKKINRSRLVEHFYKEIMTKMQTINTSQGYITINIFSHQDQLNQSK